MFERGAPEAPRSAGRGRSGDITALLRACLLVLAVPEDVATAFRVAVPLWSVADDLRISAMLIRLSLIEMTAWIAPDREANPACMSGSRTARCTNALNATNLGSGLIDHSQKMTVAAMQIADMNVWAQRS